MTLLALPLSGLARGCAASALLMLAVAPESAARAQPVAGGPSPVAAPSAAPGAALGGDPVTRSVATPASAPGFGGATVDTPVTEARGCLALAGLALAGQAGRSMPAWLDVYRTLSPEPPPPDLAEQAALAKLCGAADADCFQQPGLYWLNLGFGVAKTLLAVTDGARWIWPEVSETSDTELNLEIHPLPNGLAHAALSFEWQERVPFCGDEGDAEENEREGNCTTAASIVSTEYRNWVVDLAAHRVLWTARCSVPGAGGAIHPVTVEGNTFTWHGCDQAPMPVRFDLPRLKACTPPRPRPSRGRSESEKPMDPHRATRSHRPPTTHPREANQPVSNTLEAHQTARHRPRPPVLLAWLVAGLWVPTNPASAQPAPPGADPSVTSASVGTPAAAAPPASDAPNGAGPADARRCHELSGLALVDKEGQPQTGWLDLYRKLEIGTPDPALDDQGALALFCGDAGPACFAKPGAYWVKARFGINLALMVVGPAGRWVWPDLAEVSPDAVDAEIKPLPNGLAHARIHFEWNERVPFCGDEDEAEENEREGNCTTATSTVSSEYLDWVVDLNSHRVLWSASCSVEGLGGAAHPVTVEGNAFTWRGCEEKPVPVRFDLARLKACPPPDPNAATTESPSDEGSTKASDRTATEPSGTALNRGAELGRARKLIQSKDLPGALAIFDRLIAERAADLPLLAERGFVRMLAGDLPGAEKDLARCASEVPETDRVLRAQVFFNLGLMSEKRNEPNNARNFFERSHGYKPTKATAKRLALPAP